MNSSSSPPPTPEPAPPVIINSIRIPAGAEIVTDPDEEVFLLYSELQRTKSSSGYDDDDRSSPSSTNKQRLQQQQQFRGLGHVDSRRNILSVVIELKGGLEKEEEEGVSVSAPAEAKAPETTKRLKNREGKKKRTKRGTTRYIEDKTIEVKLVQDVTGLRSRKGDTGSVLWHASVDFARFVLQQVHTHSPECIFDLEMLRHQHILELGAGTGILSILLSPLCRRYTATDIDDLIPLIQKNINANSKVPKGATTSNIRALPLDWVVLKNTSLNRRHLLLPSSQEELELELAEEKAHSPLPRLPIPPMDILLIVDCVYHPSLLPPLIETINYLTRPNKKTTVVVVSELRSDQVVREFLELWINSSGDGGGSGGGKSWKICRCPLGMIRGPYVVWIGWLDK